jgi:hypothetical protein
VQGDVVITVDTARDALIVPTSAVSESAGDTWVVLVDGRHQTKVNVRLGLAAGGEAVIEPTHASAADADIAAGDQVLLHSEFD